MNISQYKQYFADRQFLASLLVLLGLSFVIIVLSLFSIEPGELKVPVRYSYFDARNYSLDQWYYLLAFPLFAVISATFYTMLSFKLYKLKGRLFAFGAVLLGIITMLFALVVVSSIYQVVSIS